MNLVEAWLRWLSGNKLSEDTTVCVVMCWKLLVWARWGKVIQLISATAIVVDIVGPEKLRETGKALRSIFPIGKAKQYLTSTMRWFVEAMDYYDPVDWIIESVESKGFLSYLFRIAKQSLLNRLNLICSLAICSLAVIVVFGVPSEREGYLSLVSQGLQYAGMRQTSGWTWRVYLLASMLGLGFLLVLFFMALTCISPIIISIIIFGLAISAFIIDVTIFKGTAWLLERPRVDIWVKIISLILLLIGFHFDLLAS